MDIKDYYKHDGDLSYVLDCEHTDTALTESELALVSPHLGGLQNAVHLCCGAGRHVSAFQKRGIHSIGLDISPYLLERGQLNMNGTPSNACCSFVAAEARSLPIRKERADCVTLLGNSFVLFSRKDAYLIIKEAKRILRRDGLLIMDIPDPASVIGTDFLQGEVTTRRFNSPVLGKMQSSWKRMYIASEKKLISHESLSYRHQDGSFKKKEWTFIYRLYLPGEFREMAGALGFHLVQQCSHIDQSGRYKGMMRKRIFFIMRSSSS
jgi:ubiquinone/menaquinone biosynthesis C-methylase UbiE